MPIQNSYFTTTTDGSGDYSETLTDRIYNGLLYSVEWVDGDLVDGVDAVLSVTNTPSGVDYTLLTLTDANIDKTYYPRATLQDLTGTDNGGIDYALIEGNLKLVVSDGGATKTGACIVRYLVV